MDDNLHMVFTGTEVEVWMLKGILEENGISSMIRDRLSSSLSAGFFSGTASTLELFVTGSDLEKAKPVVNEFEAARPVEPEGDS